MMAQLASRSNKFSRSIAPSQALRSPPMNRAFAAAPTDGGEEVNRRYWKRTPDGHYQRPLYIAATRQHVGKTTVSLAVLSGLQKRFDKIGTYADCN
jgi:hypothetical protein